MPKPKTQETVNHVTVDNLIESLEEVRDQYGGDLLVTMVVAGSGTNPHSIEGAIVGRNRLSGRYVVALSELPPEKVFGKNNVPDFDD
jgi:hypothetical protein